MPFPSLPHSVRLELNPKSPFLPSSSHKTWVDKGLIIFFIFFFKSINPFFGISCSYVFWLAWFFFRRIDLWRVIQQCHILLLSFISLKESFTINLLILMSSCHCPPLSPSKIRNWLWENAKVMWSIHSIPSYHCLFWTVNVPTGIFARLDEGVIIIPDGLVELLVSRYYNMVQSSNSSLTTIPQVIHCWPSGNVRCPKSARNCI